jgi:ethanolamine utilization protein EutP
MKKIILMGRTECGKTTLTQALQGKNISYHKTQYVNHFDVIIDTPGEYAETKVLARALALYSYEADVVGFLISAIEEYSLYPPCVTPCVNREVIGIVTQIDRPGANVRRAEEWLKLAGCQTIYKVSAYTGEGIWQIYEHLRQPGEVLPWDEEKAVCEQSV